MNRIATIALLLCASATSLAGQESPVSLTVGRAHAATAAPERTDTFTVELPAGSFVSGSVDQRGADVSVVVRSPSGGGLGGVDALERGTERFFFDADSAGTYRILVSPEEDDGAGEYSIVVDRVEPIAEEPEARIDQIMAPYSGEGVPGGVVAVVRDGDVVFSKAYGMADLTWSMPFEVDTRTNIGSTSKEFTAFALVLLAERGELSLDDDVRKHIPELKDFGKTITLRNLLTHTTGYREFINLLALGGRRFDEGDHVEPSELIAIVGRQPELQNEPGGEFNYNNTAFGLATMVVERVTGQPFPEWMRENVFGPLGMEDTRYRSNPLEVIPRASRGYVRDKAAGWREAKDLGGAMGAGGIYTTVGDLARWMDNFDEARVGGDDAFERMTTRYVLTDGDTTSYGLGLFVDEYRGLRRVHHGGADVAHRSMLRYYPELDAGVLALSNNADFPSGPVADRVADLFFEEHMTSDEGADGAVVAEAVGDAPFDPADFDPETFDDYAGRYSLDEAPAFVIRFWRDEARYQAQATGQGPIDIVPTSDSTFALQGVEASVTFRRNGEGEVASITLHQNGDHPGTRLEGSAWEPSAEELAAYAGRYYSAELETYYVIELREAEEGNEGDAETETGLVILHRRLAEPVELEPGQKPDAFSGGFPVAELSFERDEAGNVVALEVGNGRTRDVRFERVGAGG